MAEGSNLGSGGCKHHKWRPLTQSALEARNLQQLADIRRGLHILCFFRLRRMASLNPANGCQRVDLRSSSRGKRHPTEDDKRFEHNSTSMSTLDQQPLNTLAQQNQTGFPMVFWRISFWNLR